MAGWNSSRPITSTSHASTGPDDPLTRIWPGLDVPRGDGQLGVAVSAARTTACRNERLTSRSGPRSARSRRGTDEAARAASRRRREEPLATKICSHAYSQIDGTRSLAAIGHRRDDGQDDQDPGKSIRRPRVAIRSPQVTASRRLSSRTQHRPRRLRDRGAERRIDRPAHLARAVARVRAPRQTERSGDAVRSVMRRALRHDG